MKLQFTIALIITIVLIFSACTRVETTPVYVPRETPAPTPQPTPAPTPEPTPTPEPVPEQPITLTPTQIFDNSKNAVIIIRGENANGWLVTGSGFFVSSTGVAVTNHHVMQGLVSATAILYDGSEFPVTGFYSYDFTNDIAIIHVDGGGTQFEYLVMADSDEVRVGNNVFAVGGPDWDPITFTDGIVSRIAAEPISFDIYTIEGLIQSTAAIYQGNSGGPLLNDRGEVIGINSAGSTIRASVQFAVPSNRINLPRRRAQVNPLPLGVAQVAPPRVPGQVTMYELFPFIPDFMSVSGNASLFFSGTPADLGLSRGDVIYDYYTFLFMYSLSARHFIPDTDQYDLVLIDHGFIMQNVVMHGVDTWVYFYHPLYDASLSYAFLPESEILMIALEDGNVYELFYHGGAARTQQPQQPMQPARPVPDEIDPALVGTWRVRDLFDIGWGPHEYDYYVVFFADGFGYEDYIWIGDGESWHFEAFAWGTVDGVITFGFYNGYALFNYTITGNTLHVYNSQITLTLQRV